MCAAVYRKSVGFAESQFGCGSALFVRLHTRI